MKGNPYSPAARTAASVPETRFEVDFVRPFRKVNQGVTVTLHMRLDASFECHPLSDRVRLIQVLLEDIANLGQCQFHVVIPHPDQNFNPRRTEPTKALDGGLGRPGGPPGARQAAAGPRLAGNPCCPCLG